MNTLHEVRSKNDQLEVIMNRFGEEIKRLIFSFTKNWTVTEDLTQEVFVSVYLHLEGFREESQIKTWVYRIAINKSKDYLRSWAYRKMVITDSFTQEKDYLNEQPDILLVKNLENQQLFEQVMKLPLKYREVIILFYLKELSIEEVSEMLQLNTSTVKTRLKRGRDKLKNSFIVEGGNHDGIKA
ncbi:sigma-70 family RNA polymerase sigma factor [Cytobacillus luteolus]|nr:sigma-70 family RNA polymerase sigma factor [Cytobacillus luteolus]MBP1941948.1 RNA polymerase sigma-70 factor (ECF subfamily) [Cytobacillus luteolus]